MQEIMNVVWQSLAAILSAVLAIGGGYLIDLINSKIKNDKLKRTLLNVTAIVSNSVDSITQTTVNAFKKAGKWDATSKKKAFDEAKALIMSQLTDTSKKIVSEYNKLSIEEYLDIAIEAYIGSKAEGNVEDCK